MGDVLAALELAGRDGWSAPVGEYLWREREVARRKKRKELLSQLRDLEGFLGRTKDAEKKAAACRRFDELMLELDRLKGH